MTARNGFWAEKYRFGDRLTAAKLLLCPFKTAAVHYIGRRGGSGQDDVLSGRSLSIL